ncbi:hypothetical protein [Mesorhizobium sp. ORM16]
MEEAARRLIGVMDERAKRRASGRLQGPEQIQDQPLSPAENADGERLLGSGSLDRRPQSADADREDSCGSGLG